MTRGRSRRRERLKNTITGDRGCFTSRLRHAINEPVTSTRIGTHTRSSAAGVITHSKSTAAGIVAHSWGAAIGVGHLKGGGVSSVSVGSNVCRGGTGSRVRTFCGASNDVRVNV